MSLVNIKIEGQPYQVEAGLTVLEAAKKCGYEIPSLCTFNHGECNQGSCRVCLVAATGGGARGLVASCVFPISEGMEIRISDPKSVQARRRSVELLLSNHNVNCQQCGKNGHCELLHVAQLVGAREGAYQGVKSATTLDEIAPALVRDTSKCILCGRCIARCSNAHGLGILGFENRGFKTIVSPAENRSFANSPCIQCGQCVNVCPTGALMEKSEIDKVDAAVKAGKHVVVQVAPAVRAAIGEEFGYKIGTPTTGKMIAALRRLGFERIYDVNFGADLTIMEEGTELLHRLTNNGVLPMITSCSPGWINYAEYNYGDQLDHLSSCKSPHQMQGAMMKSFLAERKGLDPKNIVTVSIMPCTAKKFECKRDDQNATGYPDVDFVLTTRELARMIKRAGIEFTELPDEKFDDPMGEYAGGAVIFGASGGVMEAALRTAVYWITNDDTNTPVDFQEVRGFEGIKEATYTVGEITVRVAVASGLANARELLYRVQSGEAHSDFIEIMACPGGCINGGGQPQVSAEVRNFTDYRAKRAKVLYDYDKNSTNRKSHQNLSLNRMYADYLGQIGGEKAHHLLHTTYVKRGLYKDL